MKRIDFIVLHCSADPADTRKDASDVKRDHKSRGWRDVGYHYLINRDGTLVHGRPEDMRGAHEISVNSRSVAVCMIGGAPPVNSAEYRKGLGENNFTDEQWPTLKAVVTKLHEKYPDAEILGHRDIQGVRKACPSFDAREWWERVQKNPNKREGEPVNGTTCAQP